MNETWLPITGYNNLYSVSNLGRVKNIKSDRIKKFKPHRSGYVGINLRGLHKKNVTVFVHRLVLYAFCPILNPKDFQVHHINHIIYDNRIENLQWLSQGDNVRSKLYTKSFPVFEKLRIKYDDCELTLLLNKLL